MTDPMDDFDMPFPGEPAAIHAANFAPAAGRESLAATAVVPDTTARRGPEVAATEVAATVVRDEAAVARAVARVLAQAAHVGVEVAGSGLAQSLRDVLVPWLESEQYLAIGVTSRGFNSVRTPVGEGGDVAAALFAAGVVTIVFKREAIATPLDAWIAVLEDAGATPPEVLATRLWSSEHAGVGIRWRDEAAFDDGPSLDEWTAASGADAAGLTEHADLVRAFDAGPQPGAASVATDWQRSITLSPEERDRLRAETVDTTAGAARQYGRLVARRAETAVADSARQTAADALAQLVEGLVQQRRIAWLRDLFTEVRPTAADIDAPWLQSVLERLCAERNILVLGEILDDRAASADEIEAVRDVLAHLPRAVAPIASLLATSEEARSRRLICLALAAAAASDPALLVECAVGQTWYVVRNIAFVLGRIGDASVVPHLARWARHDDERVRIEVARALGRVRAAGAGEILLGLFDDRDARVRQSAVWSLCALGDRSVVARLRERIFEDKEFRDRPGEERDDFFRTYGRLVDDTAFAELQRLVANRPRFAFGWSVELRRGAVLALGETGRPEAAATLRDVAESRDRLHEDARTVLESLETGSHAPRLVDEDDWCEPARIGREPNPEIRFRLEAEDA